MRFKRRSLTQVPRKCGFCLSGVILSAKVLLDEKPEASDEQIREALSSVLCRCFAHTECSAQLRPIRRVSYE